MASTGALRSDLKAAVIFGLLIAGAIDVFWLVGLFPAMSPGAWRWPLAVLTCLMQTLLTTAGITFFAWLHRRLRVNIWFALPYGALAGAATGALSLGLSIGMRTGMIVMLAEFAYLNSALAALCNSLVTLSARNRGTRDSSVRLAHRAFVCRPCL
ncbi:MAG: hypothetical protein NT169_21700 [Chloroflexi bacterium]|nr:hypothetical protein [Chloroflexota bacterium]